MKKQNAEVFSGTIIRSFILYILTSLEGSLLSPDLSHSMIDRMLTLGYNPKAFVVWIGPSTALTDLDSRSGINFNNSCCTDYRSFRAAAPWQAAGILFPSAWDPSLAYKDRLFGSSQGFFDAFFQGGA